MTNVEPVPHPYGSSAAMRNDKKTRYMETVISKEAKA
jgi:hypothetical protein